MYKTDKEVLELCTYWKRCMVMADRQGCRVERPMPQLSVRI